MGSRIAIVATRYHPLTCGVGDQSMRTAQALREAGHEVLVLAMPGAAPHPDAPSIPLEAYRGATPLLRARDAAARLARFRPELALLEYTPAMFGASRLGSPAAPWLARALRRAGARVHLVLHELWFPLLRRPDLLAGALAHRAVVAALLRTVDRAIVTTPSRAALLERLSARVGGAAAVSVVPIGSNVAPVPAAPAPGFRIGVFSTLAVGKRFDVVLEAFARVAAEEGAAELVLMGDLGRAGEKRHDALAGAVARHPHAARIRLTGRLDSGAIAREVASLRAFAFPMDTGATTRSSTLPLALGAGVPVVAIRGTETSALFAGDENVVFADGLDGASFARALLRLRDPALARRVGEGGRRLYEAHLAWPTLAAALVARG